MKMSNNNIVELYNEKANAFIEHYDGLTKIVRETLFPWNFTISSGLPDSKNWSENKKKFYLFIMPLSIFDPSFIQANNSSYPKFWSGLVWLFIYLNYYVFGMTTLIVTSQIHKATNATPTQSSNSATYLAWLLISIFVVIALLMYGQVIWYLFNRKISWKNKVLWLGSFLVFIYLVYLQIFEVIPNFPNLLYSSPLARIILLFSVFIFWIPVGILTASLLLIFGKLIIYVIFSLLLYYTQANSPDYSFLVKKILQKNISTSDNSSIYSLPTSEIVALKEWAQRNLDVTEKRTIPVLIFLAILGATVTFAPLQNLLSNSFVTVLDLIHQNLINSSKSLQGFISYLAMILGIGTILLIIAVIAIVYVQLLSNLFVQGIVIEVCTVAEYAKSAADDELNKRKQHRSLWQILLDWLSRGP